MTLTVWVGRVMSGSRCTVSIFTDQADCPATGRSIFQSDFCKQCYQRSEEHKQLSTHRSLSTGGNVSHIV